MWAERARLIAAIEAQGLIVSAGEAPFFLVSVGHASRVCAALLAEGVMVRDCTSFGLPAQVRISPRTAEDGDKLLDALRRIRPVIDVERHETE